MAELSTASKNIALDAVFNAAATTYYVALYSTGPVELSGNGYARVEATFGAAASSALANDAAVTFGPATGTNWSEATDFAVFTASSGGTAIAGPKALSAARTVEVGQTATFAIGALDVTASDS